MEMKNKKIIAKLAELGVLGTEPVKANVGRKEDDIIIGDYDDAKRRVITGDITNEELLIMIETVKLERLTSIKKMVKVFFIFFIVELVCQFVFALLI